MGTDKLTGAQKAALFLFSLGEELAAEIVKNLDAEEIKKLGASMAKISAVQPKSMESIFSEFQQLAAAERAMPLSPNGRNQFLKKVFSKALAGEENGQALMDEMMEQEKWNLFQKVRQLDPKTLATFMKGEHPQTIAIILAHLEPNQTAAILGEFVPDLQTEVLFRISQLGNVPPGILEEIDKTLQEEISVLENFEGGKVGGIRSVADILNHLDGSVENAVLEKIEGQKKGLADEIRRLMFVFEDLNEVEDRSLMAILKEVNGDSLKLALKTASDELKEKMFKNMSERAAQMMKEDLEVMGPVRLKDVEAAQQAIIKSAKKLENEGKIVLKGKGNEEVYV